MPALTGLLSHNASDVRVAAAWALWKIDRHADGLATLEKHVFHDERASDGFLAAGTYVDDTVVCYLGEIGPDARKAMPTLEKALKHVESTWPDMSLTVQLPSFGGRSSQVELSLRGKIVQAMERIDPARKAK